MTSEPMKTFSPIQAFDFSQAEYARVLPPEVKHGRR